MRVTHLPRPLALPAEYCGRGSLTDVLRGGRGSPAKARLLDWARRLNMALDAAKGMHCELAGTGPGLPARAWCKPERAGASRRAGARVVRAWPAACTTTHPTNHPTNHPTTRPTNQPTNHARADLHEHVPPILHRDLKSPNLLVDKHWRVKVRGAPQ